MSQTLTILSITLNPESDTATTGTFSYKENQPGAAVLIVGNNVTMSPNGVLDTPIAISGLLPGKTYRVKCVLNCGTSYAKLYTIPEGCPEVENLSVLVLKNAGVPVGLKVMFTHIFDYNNYVIDLYKKAPADLDIVFLNSYNVITTIGEIVLSDVALLQTGIDYSVRISRICKNITSAPSNFVTYTITE